MKISIVLLNWNQTAITIRCIESVFMRTGQSQVFNFSLVVVDNGSETVEVKALAKFIAQHAAKSIHLIQHPSNTGFAGGNNIGIRYALDQHVPDYIWLLNNDTILQERALDQLALAAMSQPQIKVWGSTIYELHPKLHFHCAGGFRYNTLLSIPSPLPLPVGVDLKDDLYHITHGMDYPAGVSMFVRADVFQKHGLMCEDYFLYYEELDLVQQIGGKQHLAWCPSSILHHEAGQSTGSKNPNEGRGSFIAHYYGNLSALKYTWKYHKSFFPFVFIFRAAAKSLLFLKHRDLRAFAPLSKAYLAFFKWLFRNEK